MVVVTREHAPAVQITDLRVDYGDHVAVENLSLEIPSGEIFGLIGPNGAGKTSTFRVLATLLAPTYGEVYLCGLDIAEQRRKVRRLLGYMPDLAPVPTDLKVWEFLDLFAGSHGLKRSVRRGKVEEALGYVQLLDRWGDRCHALSRGMKQRLALAKTMLHEPKVMLLDEPASGMDPISRAALRRTLQVLSKKGTTIVVSSHILTELSAMCTSVGIMSKGSLVASGSVDSVLQRFGGKKLLLIDVLSGHAQASVVLEGCADVSHVEEREGGFTARFDGDHDSQASLLEKLLAEGCRLHGFSEKTRDIESVLLGLEEPETTQALPSHV